MRLLANIVSLLFHPLLMVTYGMILATMFTYLSVYPSMMKLMAVGGTFFSTALVPGLFLLLMIKSRLIADVELSDRKEQTVPYLIFITSILSCIFFLYKLLIPLWFLSLLVGACIALFMALFINLFWKISAHAIGIGGLLGGIMGISKIHLLNSYGCFIVVILVAGLLGTSRIILKRHTPMQVYVGFCLGFICTFVTSLLSYIYLFI